MPRIPKLKLISHKLKIDLNKTSDQFTEFVDQLKETIDGTASVFGSYALPLDNIKLNNVIEAYNHTSYFFWQKPSENCALTAFDKLLELNSENFSSTENFDQFLKDLKARYRTNFSDYNLDGVPVYFGASKFTDSDKTILWSDYGNENWFIPEFILANKSGKSFFIFNFDYVICK